MGVSGGPWASVPTSPVSKLGTGLRQDGNYEPQTEEGAAETTPSFLGLQSSESTGEVAGLAAAAGWCPETTPAQEDLVCSAAQDGHAPGEGSGHAPVCVT